MSDLPDSPESEGAPVVCPRCGTSYGGNFCPSCGWPAGVPLPARTSTLRTILGVVWLFAVILFLVYLAAMLGALLWITPRIVEGIGAGACTACTAFFFWINPLNPALLDVVEVGGPALLAWFLILLTVILGIYLYLVLFTGRRTYRDMRLPAERIENKLGSRSAVVAVGQVFMALLFFDLLYFSVILPLGFGIVPEAPPFFSEAPEWYVLYTTVNAAVWEEIATRLLLIGLPMALAAFVTRLPRVVTGNAGHNPGRARYLAGALKYLFGGQLREGSPRAALFVGGGLVLASAAIFGYLHVPAWGAWKFVDTFLAGLALGYLFLRHGILASILLHLSVNSLGILFSAAGGETNLGGSLLVGILYLVLVAFGAGFFVYYAKRTGGILFGWLRRGGGKPVPAPPPQPVRGNPGGDLLLFPVICPQCGGDEAHYQDGALLCSRCGTRLSSPSPDRGRG
ncbi:MAG: CPBP family intramembrane metalloprotease [Candidatus Thermoplasmatota archaeon]|nr:CPBP family intramembrane metalloprotease [Candidatus Thermoplasmatota archaeon]